MRAKMLTSDINLIEDLCLNSFQFSCPVYDYFKSQADPYYRNYKWSVLHRVYGREIEVELYLSCYGQVYSDFRT